MSDLGVSMDFVTVRGRIKILTRTIFRGQSMEAINAIRLILSSISGGGKLSVSNFTKNLV